MDIVKLIKPNKILFILIIIFFNSSCNDKSKLFELNSGTGIEFNNKLSPTPSLNILSYLYYYNGAGIASEDFNNDGLTDLYFTGNQVQDKHASVVKAFDFDKDVDQDIVIGSNALPQNFGRSAKNYIFENTGKNEFKKVELPFLTQISTIRTLYLDDLNKDGFEDILIAGNNIEISTQLGRLDAFHGTLLLNNQKGFFTIKTDQTFDISDQARDIKKMTVNEIKYFIISINNNTAMIFKNNE